MTGVRVLRWLGRRPDWPEGGRDPDYRFSLANERTFLSWVRTSLAVMAAAVAVVQLVPARHLHETRRALGIVLAVLGLLMSATAYGGGPRTSGRCAPVSRCPGRRC